MFSCSHDIFIHFNICLIRIHVCKYVPNPRIKKYSKVCIETDKKYTKDDLKCTKNKTHSMHFPSSGFKATHNRIKHASNTKQTNENVLDDDIHDDDE